MAKKTLVVSLDCSGAFDRILFQSMVEATGKVNLLKCIINWYTHVLENRTILAEVQGQKYVAYPTKGTPQRGVLSPLIWIHYLVRPTGYADDIVLYITGFDHDTMAGIMTQALHTIWKWEEKQGLIFNPSKRWYACTNRTEGTKMNPVYTGGKKLLYQSNVKYLGITIDKLLTWSKHVDERINK